MSVCTLCEATPHQLREKTACLPEEAKLGEEAFRAAFSSPYRVQGGSSYAVCVHYRKEEDRNR